MLTAPNLAEFEWLTHGFGMRDTKYPPGITRLKQIHSAIVLDAAAARDGFAAEGDAIVSHDRGVLIGVRTADCVPVLIADPVSRSVAAVHAGWRGAAQNIVEATTRELVTRFGSRPEDLRAAIGPAIGVCCYEVGPDVARRFGAWAPEYADAERPIRIDLARINAAQLAEAGVRDIWTAGECTFCNLQRYFSFRREKEAAGRMTSFIGVK